MDEPTRKLLPVTAEELEQAVSHAQRYDGRKHFKRAGEIMGKITAAHLVRYLTRSGFVVMKPSPSPLGCAYAESAVRAMEAGRLAGGDDQGKAWPCRSFRRSLILSPRLHKAKG